MGSCHALQGMRIGVMMQTIEPETADPVVLDLFEQALLILTSPSPLILQMSKT